MSCDISRKVGNHQNVEKVAEESHHPIVSLNTSLGRVTCLVMLA